MYTWLDPSTSCCQQVSRPMLLERRIFWKKFLDCPVSSGGPGNLYKCTWSRNWIWHVVYIQVVLVVLELCIWQFWFTRNFSTISRTWSTVWHWICTIITLYGRNTSLTILDQSLSEVSTLYRMEIMTLFNENFQPHIKRHHLQ